MGYIWFTVLPYRGSWQLAIGNWQKEHHNLRVIETDIMTECCKDLKDHIIAFAFAILNYNCQLPFANCQLMDNEKVRLTLNKNVNVEFLAF